MSDIQHKDFPDMESDDQTDKFMEALFGRDEDIDDETAREVLAAHGIDSKQLVNEFILRLASELRKTSAQLTAKTAELEAARARADDLLDLRVTDTEDMRWPEELRVAVKSLEDEYDVELYSHKFLMEWVARCEGVQEQADCFARLLAENESRCVGTEWLETETTEGDQAVAHLITRRLAVRHEGNSAWWRFVEANNG